MAQRMVRFSDLTNKIIEDDQLVRLVIDQHPALEDGPVEIEAMREEVEPIRKQTLNVVSLKLYEGDSTEPESITMEADAFNKLAGDMDMADIIRRAQPAYPPRRKTAAPAAPAAEKIDYGSVDHAGRPKRGKVSDAEKATVAAHLDKVNERLKREGHRTIDLDNTEHVARYGLEKLAKEAGHFQQ